MARVKSSNSASERKTCVDCGRNKLSDNFYKTNSTLFFPDGRLNMCSDCVKKNVIFSDVNMVNEFLRQMDMPFVSEVWEESLKRTDTHPIGFYLKMMHNPKYKTLRYKDSNDVASIDKGFLIKDDAGNPINIDEVVMVKWGKESGYSTEDYIRLEKFYRNMKYNYDINNPVQEELLIEVAKLNIEKDKLLRAGDFANHKRASDTYSKTLADAGFRPVDKKNSLDEAGITSFGQVVQTIERDGFIPPKMVNYEKDDIDIMLLYYIQWAQGFTDRAMDIDIDPNWRDRVDLSMDIVNIDENENISDDKRDYSQEAIESVEEEIGIVGGEVDEE